MKRYLIMAVAAMLLLASCEKKNDPTPDPEDPTATGSFVLTVNETQILNDTTVRISDLKDNYGELEMDLVGTIAPVDGLTAYSVTIQRPTADCFDQFCSAGKCVNTDGELEQTINFGLSSSAEWYAHYVPASQEVAAQATTIVYTFKGGKRTLKLTAIYQAAE